MAHLYESDSDWSSASEDYLNDNFPGLINEDTNQIDSDVESIQSPQPGPSHTVRNNIVQNGHIFYNIL